MKEAATPSQRFGEDEHVIRIHSLTTIKIADKAVKSLYKQHAATIDRVVRLSTKSPAI
jgi:hypothetical protein